MLFRIRVAILAALSLAIPACAAQDKDSDAWEGVWHISMRQETGGEAVVVLSINGLEQDQVAALGLNGRPHKTVSFSQTGDNLKFSFAYSSKVALAYSLDVVRKGNELVGRWILAHPQFKTGGEVSGFKVCDQAPWNPFETILRERRAGLIDATTRAAELARSGDWPGFINYLESEYLPGYYILFANWPDYEGWSSRRQLRNLYANLRDRDLESFVSRATEINEGTDALLGALRRDVWIVMGPLAPRPVDKVSLWSGPKDPLEDTACCSQKADIKPRDQDYLVVNPLLWPTGSPPAGAILAKELICAHLWPEEVQETGLKLAREGIGLVLGNQVAEGTLSGSVVSDELRDRLRDDLEKKWSETADYYMPDPFDLDCPGYTLASAIAEKLLAKYSLEEIRDMDPPRMFQEWEQYLQQ